jgi:hypothetical protein
VRDALGGLVTSNPSQPLHGAGPLAEQERPGKDGGLPERLPPTNTPLDADSSRGVRHFP